MTKIRFIILIWLIAFFINSAAKAQNKIEVDLLLGGEYIVTIDDKLPIIRDGVVAVRDGRILAIGSREKITSGYVAPHILPGDGMVLMPGLINGHTHAAMTLFRGLADDKALMDWLHNYIFPAESRFVDTGFVRVGTQLACLEMIRGGTTTFVDMYFYPDTIAEVTEKCGLRAIIAAAVIDFPSPGFKGWDDSFAAAKLFIQKWKNHNLITPTIGPHAVYTVAPEHIIQVDKVARRNDVPIVIHVSETKNEVNDIKKRYGKRPMEHLNSLGVLNSNMIAAHMVWPDLNEIKLLAKQGVGVVHNPSSNLKLASGFAPIHTMLKHGIKIGLGTDGAASNNDLDMWQEINMTALIHKGNLLDPTVLPAKTVLRMATLGGAEAIELGQEIGAITSGRRADLIQVRIGNNAHSLPIYNIISHLVYSVKSTDVVNVVVNGKFLMRDRNVLTIDRNKVTKEAKQLSMKIATANHRL